MKNDKKLFILIELVLTVVVMVLAFLMLQGKYGKEAPKVSVIVQNSDDAQWTAFVYGLEMAAQDRKIELFVVTTGNALTLEEQKDLIESELANGADAVIVQPVLGDDTEKMVSRIQKKLPVMLVEYTASQDSDASVLPTVEPDNYAMGTALAEELLRDYNGNIKGKTLGIFAENEESEAVRNRRQGFTDTLKDAGAEICWMFSSASVKDEENSVEAQEKVDFVIALDDSSLTDAGNASAANNLHGALVYGIGHSTEAVYYLDAGYVECLVVPDEFSVGYQSLTEIAEKLSHPMRKMQDIMVAHTVIRRETLFTKENQEILYTMSQ